MTYFVPTFKLLNFSMNSKPSYVVIFVYENNITICTHNIAKQVADHVIFIKHFRDVPRIAKSDY